ncbi:PIN-like domain-containing protein [Paenibacillus xylanexedens]|uniref:PIN-like domain-containing protein n=1 Tax=Paenibacillus xylanexedens TaxID=528191 RepID=UPI003CFBCAB3
MTKNIEKFFFKPRKLDEIINTANVVFDTNALLSAYQWKDVVFHEVLEALNKLSDANRLKIPAQVFKEFIHQRPLKIMEAINQIDLLISSIQNPKKLGSVLPLLGLIDNNNTYVESEKAYSASREKYKGDLNQIKNKLKELFNDDIVLDYLKPFFEKIDFSIDFEDKGLLQHAENRAKAKIPPLTGGDGGKAENKYGDFFIWQYILSLNSDVIFVTTDAKEDWFYKSGAGKEKKPVSPRRELIEEFYEVSKGRTICIVPLSDFMKEFKPGLAKEVVENLSEHQTLEMFFVYTLSCKSLINIGVNNIFDFINKVDLGDIRIIDRMLSGEKGSFKDFIGVDEEFKIVIETDNEIDSSFLIRKFNESNTLFYVSYIGESRVC